jgi:hypothetical protein
MTETPQPKGEHTPTLSRVLSEFKKKERHHNKTIERYESGLQLKLNGSSFRLKPLQRSESNGTLDITDSPPL